MGEGQNALNIIRIETITSRSDLSSVKERWDNLCQRCYNTVPYLTYEWYSSALETIDSDKTPFLIFFRQGSEDVGLAPFVYNKKQMFPHPLHMIGFIDNPYTPYQGIIHAIDFKDILTSLIELIRQRFGNWFVLNLDEIRLNPYELQTIEKLSSQKNLFLYQKEEKNGSRYLLLKDSFEENLKSLIKHTQKEFKRKINRISRTRKIGLERVSGHEHIDHHLEIFFNFYARTWKGAEPHPEFYYRMCHEFEKRSQLYFHALTLNGKPIAYLISILSGDTMYGIKTTYNPSFYAYSPGVLLFYNIIEDMFNIKGVREFDIGRGEEQFKREWTSLTHNQVRLYLYPSSLAWKIITSLKYELLPMLKKNERFNACYSAVRSLITVEKQACDTVNLEQTTSQKTFTRYEFKECKPGSCSLNTRFATLGDLDLMAVVTAARNFAEIQDRLEKESCVLCFEEDKLLSFFWLKHDINQHDNDTIPNHIIYEWGLRSDRSPSHSLDVLISGLLIFLKDTINKPDCVVHINERNSTSFELF
jgi:CelD/BcsL family acetyltransferase involved in cellulose biosynthesis